MVVNAGNQLKLYIYIVPFSGDALLKVLYMQLLLPAQALSTASFLFVRESHLLPSQLTGEHTAHEAATRCSEPIRNAHFSSTHHHCWYSFYLPIKGWRVESIPSQVESGVSTEPRTSHRKAHCSTN